MTHEPFTIEIGMGMAKGFYEWIQASFDKGSVQKSGEVVAADFDYRAQSARVFQNALITEVTIPALDGGSKEPAYMTVKIDPERIRYEQRNGEQLNSKIGGKTKLWQTSNFRVDLGSLPCDNISKVDSFTWKQSIIKDAVGAFREATKHPSKVEVPNLKFTISMADLAPWQDWHQSFLIDGKCSETDHLTGAITFLGPDTKEELGTIELFGVGISALTAAAQEANKDDVARFEVSLYVEEMKFKMNVTDM
jgi:hypothetical protein